MKGGAQAFFAQVGQGSTGYSFSVRSGKWTERGGKVYEAEVVSSEYSAANDAPEVLHRAEFHRTGPRHSESPRGARNVIDVTPERSTTDTDDGKHES